LTCELLVVGAAVSFEAVDAAGESEQAAPARSAIPRALAAKVRVKRGKMVVSPLVVFSVSTIDCLYPVNAKGVFDREL
jgi:hypothetical protein